jgi:hypothetical protein
MLLPHQVLPIYLSRLALQPLCWGRRRLNIWRMAYGTAVIRTKPEMSHRTCTTFTGNDFPLIRLTVTRSGNTLFYPNPPSTFILLNSPSSCKIAAPRQDASFFVRRVRLAPLIATTARAILRCADTTARNGLLSLLRVFNPFVPIMLYPQNSLTTDKLQ